MMRMKATLITHLFARIWHSAVPSLPEKVIVNFKIAIDNQHRHCHRHRLKCPAEIVKILETTFSLQTVLNQTDLKQAITLDLNHL